MNAETVAPIGFLLNSARYTESDSCPDAVYEYLENLSKVHPISFRMLMTAPTNYRTFSSMGALLWEYKADNEKELGENYCYFMDSNHDSLYAIPLEIGSYSFGTELNLIKKYGKYDTYSEIFSKLVFVHIALCAMVYLNFGNNFNDIIQSFISISLAVLVFLDIFFDVKRKKTKKKLEDFQKSLD